MSNDSVVVNMSSESEQEPVSGQMITRKKKQPMSKEYMKDYYHKHKGVYVCEHCERIYAFKSSLIKHQGRSIKCYIQRVKTVLDEIKHGRL